ncbi:MAG: STAS domain-containing protein [SAR324 cluster bacterium]|nr:STAS domain-containing protein [SAR324 cluster bacterium]
MKLTHCIKSKIIIIHPMGELVINHTRPFKSYITALLNDHQPLALIINCKDIECVDSAGIGAMLSISKETKMRNIGFACFQMHDNLYGVFDAVGLIQMIPIYRTEEEALAFFQASL